MISTNHISHIVAHRLEPPMLQTHGASTPTTRVWQFHTLTHMIESRGWNYCFSYYHTETNDCPPIFRAPLRIHISTLFAITLRTSRGSKRLFVLQLWRHSDSTCTITRLFFSSTPTGQEYTIDSQNGYHFQTGLTSLTFSEINWKKIRHKTVSNAYCFAQYHS